jgi:tetratricopeptide (TPR) repeat protein
MNFEELLTLYSNNSNDPDINFNLAHFYELNDQLSSAISFYLRSAELSNDRYNQYECLIRIALCLNRLENRNNSVKVLLQQAIALDPIMPDAYFLLSQYYEKVDTSDNKWIECYMITSVAVKMCNINSPKLKIPCGYNDQHDLLNMYFLASFNIGHNTKL